MTMLTYVESLRSQTDGDGSAIVDAPRTDSERTRLAVAERAGALTVDPASGGRLLVQVEADFEPSALAPACRVAEDRGWRAYRAVEAFSFSDRCRRRQLLDHFGDQSELHPEGRCCDACDPDGWLPDPGSLAVKRTRSSPKKRGVHARRPTSLPAMRRSTKPCGNGDWVPPATARPTTWRANRTLIAIATVKPSDEAQLAEIAGVGPAFMEKYGSPVLRIVSDHS